MAIPQLSSSKPCTTVAIGRLRCPIPRTRISGNAQQVTGMLGATVLDDVDEGDETFGDESELMND